MERIRLAIPQDIPYLYDISLRTSMPGEDGRDYYNDSYCVGHYFCAPYFFFEPSLCFVAVDKNDKPAGYIVGTSDTTSFNKWMNTSWLPPLRKHYSSNTNYKSTNEERMINRIHRGAQESEWETTYPSHLHINLLPCLQKQGLGKALMETFVEAVKKTNAKGIHLGVSGTNKNAIGFYEAIGFNKLKDQSWGANYGIKL